jgi:S-adenosylmethionine hydrolase
MTRTIALLTDFGTVDPYVGVMKGVMLGIAPDAALVDLTHAVQPQKIKQAAFLLLNSYRYFPSGTVFLVVVDPGVGSARKPIAVQAGDYSFVAPDNGVLSYVLRESGGFQAFVLESEAFRLSGTSNTFHGRDIFAPAAAHLAAGVALEKFGAQVEQPVMLPEPLLALEAGGITGEVLHIDHFGTAVTSIGLLQREENQLTLYPRFGAAEPLPFAADGAIAIIGNQCLTGIRRTYAEVGQGEQLALVGSSGYLELSINGGNFAERFGVKLGDTVELHQ